MATTFEPLHPAAPLAAPDVFAPPNRLDMVRAFAVVSQRLDPDISSEWIVKRILFLKYELQSLISLELPIAMRLKQLNDFIFKQKKFKTLIERSRSEIVVADDPTDHYRLGNLLNKRAGFPTVVALLYAFLAEGIGVELEFVDLKATNLLRWTDRNESPPRSRYLDINREGAILTNDELIETLHSLCPASTLDAFTFSTYICNYLRDLKASLIRKGDPEQLLFLQNLMVDLEPANLRLLGERALLHRRLGNFKSAIRDLKRYFAFHDRTKAPTELVILYEELSQLLDRDKSPINLLD